MTRKLGFTKINNRLLEKLCFFRLTDRQKRIILVVARFSYGCHKTSAPISKSDLCLIGIDKSDRARELKRLEDLCVLFWDSTRRFLSINPKMEEWRLPMYRGFNEERFSALLHKSLVKHQPNRWQNAKDGVGKLPALKPQNSNNHRENKTAKESVNKANKESYSSLQEDLRKRTCFPT